MDNMEFSNRLTELRKSKGLSQKELGEMLGVSNKAVSKWENGESMPKTSTMLKLAEIMEIDGNELIGFEKAEATELAANSEELDQLRSENALLSSRLSAIEKRRKRILIGVAFVCAVCIIASGIIAFCFTAGNRTNNDVKDAGQDNTKIIFADNEYLPPAGDQWLIINECQRNGALKNYFDDRYYEYDEKYADYYDKDGNKQKIVVKIIDKSDKHLFFNVGKKSYCYFNKNYSKSFIEYSKIASIDITNYEDDYYYTNYLFDNEVNLFCKFYKNKGNSVDKKIMEQYMKYDALDVTVYFNQGVDIIDVGYQIGKIFKDDDGNAYYLDYSNNEVYKLGEELTKYVF